MKGCVNCEWHRMSPEERAETARALRRSMREMGWDPDQIEIPGTDFHTYRDEDLTETA